MRQFFLVDNLEGDDKMEEIWKDIEGYEGLYQVSNLGRVKSFYKEGRILKQCIDKDGYFCVGLFKNKKQEEFYCLYLDNKKKYLDKKEDMIRIVHFIYNFNISASKMIYDLNK